MAWQAPDQFGDRFRWAVGTIAPRSGGYSFRYLEEGAEFEALNQGRSFDEIRALGYTGYPAFTPTRIQHDREALSPFMRRLPPRSRSDFQEYVKLFRLSAKLKMSDFELLGRTEAKLPSDDFSLVDPLDPRLNWCDLMLEIAGYRYYVPNNQPSMAVGFQVDVLPEPNNPKDKNAVQFCIQGKKIGNVNRLQTGAFLKWLENCSVSAVIERLNGTAEKPGAFVFVRVRPAQAAAAA